MILVGGATGNVGRELAGVLASAGEPVRALTRQPEKVTLPVGAVAVGGDLNDPDSLCAALDGTRGMFLLSGYRDLPGLLARASRAGVRQVVLLSGGHDGRVYPLTGPESLLPADRVGVLGAVLGRDLRFVGQSDGTARAEMTASMPGEYVDGFFRFFADGMLDESAVLPTAADVTGRPPRTFR